MFLFVSGLSWLVLLLLLVVGIGILVFVIRSALFLLPPALVALVVHYLTGDMVLTGISFIAVVLLMLLVRR